MIDDELSLAGIRILDLTEEVAGPYCTMLLAGLGADVVKVEPPDGESGRTVAPFANDLEGVERSLRFLHLNRGKRGIVLDPAAPADREALRALLMQSDVVIADGLVDRALAGWQLSLGDLRAAHRQLVAVSLPPFASGKRWETWLATELTLCAASGAASCTGQPGRHPLKTGGYLSLVAQGQTALAATLAALLDARRSGVGSDVEVAGSEANAEMLGMWTGGRRQRMPRLGRLHQVNYPWHCYGARDGWVGVQAGPSPWSDFCELIEAPDLARYEPLSERIAARQQIDGAIERWLGGLGKVDAYHAGQSARFGFGYVADARDIVHSEQLAARGFFRIIEHPSAPAAAYPGPPFQLASGWRDARAPLLDEHRESILAELKDLAPPTAPVADDTADRDPTQPLRGIRVLDLTQIWAGPRAAMTLADYGAEVIKIESPDRVRRPPAGMSEREVRRSSGQENLHRGKRHVTIDLRSDLGRKAFEELVAVSDVVIANFAAGVMDRLGATYQHLEDINPAIVVISMTGFGETGPERSYVAYGVAQEQLCGIYGATGYEGEEPLKSGYNIGDPMNGMHAVAATLAALIERARTGRGQFVDFSQFESSIPFIGEMLLDFVVNGRVAAPAGNRDPNFAPQGVYPARGEDRFVAISIRDDGQWRALLDVLGATSLADDARFQSADGRREHHRDLDAALERYTRERDDDQLSEALQRAGIPALPVLHTDEVWQHPEYLASGFIQTMTHTDGGEYVYTGPMWRINGVRPLLRTPAPQIGEHTAEILTALTSLSDKELGELT